MGPKFRHSGIRSKTLLELVRNTAPFVFEDDAFESHPYGEILRTADKNPPDESDLHAYFDLCLASHFATVGTFVPTDVDLAIREKLWSFVHDESAFAPMWNRAQEFLTWDERLVSMRLVGEGERKLSGHQGEWLTVSMGAYATAKRIGSEFLPEIREAIENEVKREEQAISFLRVRFSEEPTVESMKDYLSGIAAVAHNLGDLDRMFDAFTIEDTDVLKRRVYRAAHEDSKNFRPVFQEAGRIYQELIASENHRNFALRSPKGLRKSALFLLPFGLFLDDWGVGLVENGVKAGILSEGDLREIIEALVSGWKKLNPKSIYTSQGYSRALAGIAQGLGGRSPLLGLVPPSIKKELEESGLRTLMNTKKDVFEKKLQLKLLNIMNLNS
jgi:hypothetical protein